MAQEHYLTLSQRVTHWYVDEDLNPLIMLQQGNISSRFSSISEASASEILENL